MTLALRAAAFVAVAFGVLTLSSGARVLFGDGAAAAGRYVPFIGMDAHRGSRVEVARPAPERGRMTLTDRP